jgi:hypothetical protein
VHNPKERRQVDENDQDNEPPSSKGEEELFGVQPEAKRQTGAV